MRTFEIQTKERCEFLDITGRVAQAVADAGISSGICVVFCPHTTAALTINENADPAVQSDIVGSLGKLVPAFKGYLHAEGNSDGHIKSSLVGNSLTVIINEKRLALGTWQGIYLCEFDGPRVRHVQVKCIQG